MEESNKVLVIVPCGKRKIWNKQLNAKKVLAKDAYISPYFRLCKLYAERFSDKWVIFSGKYGIIDQNTPIEDYDSKLVYGKIKREFYHKIKKQLENLLVEYRIIVSLCGKEYSKIIKDVIDCDKVKLYTPLSGLKIGKRMKKLRECIENDISLL